MTPARVAIAREQWKLLIANRPPHYRQIIEMRLQRHTYDEIAEKLRVNKKTVYRVLKKLLHQVGI